MSGSKTPIVLIDLSSSEDDINLCSGEESNEVQSFPPVAYVRPVSNSSMPSSSGQWKTKEEKLLLSSVNLVPVKNESVTITQVNKGNRPYHINGVAKKNNNCSIVSSGSRHISPSFLGSTSLHSSKAEQKNSQTTTPSLSNSLSSPLSSVKRKELYTSKLLEPKRISLSHEASPVAKRFRHALKTFHGINGITKKESVKAGLFPKDESLGKRAIENVKELFPKNESSRKKTMESAGLFPKDESLEKKSIESVKAGLFFKEESAGKKTMESFVNVVKHTCTKVLNSVTTEYVKSVEQSVEKCSASYLESSKCKALIEENTQKIRDHLNSIQSCITQVADELKSHSRSCNKPETYSTMDCAMDEASSSSAITEKSSSSCNYLQLVETPSSHNFLESAEKSCIDPQYMERASSSHHQSPPDHNQGVACNADFDLEEGNADRELQKKIRGYEKLLKKLNEKIKKYRESEIMDDDDEDSAYIRQDRLERKALQISKILWKLNNESFNTGRPIQKKILYQGTRYPEVNVAIQNLVNKKKFFPDFTDVLEAIDATSKECELCIPDIFTLAKTVFQDIFHEIKDRRIQDHEMHFNELLGDDCQDPAENNEEWQQQLEENNIQAQQRIQEIIDHYATIPEKQKSENPSSENPKEEENSEDDDDDEKSDNEEEKSDNEEEKLDAENGDSFIEDECLSSSESDHDGKEVVKDYETNT